MPGRGFTLATAVAATAHCLACSQATAPLDAGCSVPDAGPSDAGPFETAVHTPFPQATDAGGPVLTAPQLVTVTFPGYAEAAHVQGLGAWIASSDWISSIGKDYGVGPGSQVAEVVLPSAAPGTLSDQDIQQLLAGDIANSTLPAPTPNTLYVLYIPASTAATSFAGGPDCGAALGHIVGGYHWEAQPSTGTPFPYAVIASCEGQAEADLDLSASHEIAEGLTDPFPSSNPSWGIWDTTSSWSYNNVELADLCVLQTITDNGYSLARVWSNSAAAAGADPCVPVAANALPYFNVSITPSGVATVAAATTLTYQLTGWSLAPVPDWGLSMLVSPYSTFTPATELSVDTLNNGGTATLTLIIPPGTPSGSTADVLVLSQLSSNETAYWPVAVNTK
jgi:hypothetical protein